MSPAPAPTRGQLLRHALRLRCPYCGAGGFVRQWFRLAERCPNCGLATDRVEGHWIGAIGMNTIVSFGALLVVLVVSVVLTYPDLPVAPVLTVALIAAVTVPLVAWPFSQTLWTAVDIMMRPVQIQELDPRYTGR